MRPDHDPALVRVVCERCGRFQPNRHIELNERTLARVFYLGCIGCGHPYGVYHPSARRLRLVST